MIQHLALAALAATPSPSPSLDPSVLEPDPLMTVAAVAAIVLALIAGVIGYRIIRGGRGL